MTKPETNTTGLAVGNIYEVDIVVPCLSTKTGEPIVSIGLRRVKGSGPGFLTVVCEQSAVIDTDGLMEWIGAKRETSWSWESPVKG